MAVQHRYSEETGSAAAHPLAGFLPSGQRNPGMTERMVAASESFGDKTLIVLSARVKHGLTRMHPEPSGDACFVGCWWAERTASHHCEVRFGRRSFFRYAPAVDPPSPSTRFPFVLPLSFTSQKNQATIAPSLAHEVEPPRSQARLSEPSESEQTGPDARNAPEHPAGSYCTVSTC